MPLSDINRWQGWLVIGHLVWLYPILIQLSFKFWPVFLQTKCLNLDSCTSAIDNQCTFFSYYYVEYLRAQGVILKILHVLLYCYSDAHSQRSGYQKAKWRSQVQSQVKLETIHCKVAALPSVATFESGIKENH